MDRSKRALERNLHELGRARLERKALVGMEAAKSKHAVDFFRLAYDALFNDMIAHAVKVLDKNKDSETFWSIYKRDESTIRQFISNNNYDLDKLEKVSDKLKVIRDKTHFHIDKMGVLQPNKVWETASLKGSELAEAIDMAWEVLRYVHRVKFGEEFNFPEYDGTDVTRIITAEKKRKERE